MGDGQQSCMSPRDCRNVPWYWCFTVSPCISVSPRNPNGGHRRPHRLYQSIYLVYCNKLQYLITQEPFTETPDFAEDLALPWNGKAWFLCVSFTKSPPYPETRCAFRLADLPHILQGTLSKVFKYF